MLTGMPISSVWVEDFLSQQMQSKMSDTFSLSLLWVSSLM